MEYKGIIFDFNGVLLWDSPLHEKAWNQMSVELRGRPFTPEEITTRLHGRNNKDIFTFVIGHPVTDEEYKELARKKENLYMHLASNDLTNYHLPSGAETLLDEIVARNIPHTIATASEKVLIDFYERHLHLSRWFDLLEIVYNDGTLPGKPAPDVYLRSADKLGLDPKDCVVIEDAHSGIQAAHTAGIGFIVALGPKEKHEELRRLPGVNHVVTTLSEITADDLFVS